MLHSTKYINKHSLNLTNRIESERMIGGAIVHLKEKLLVSLFHMQTDLSNYYFRLHK